jgi:hypothetical protein
LIGLLEDISVGHEGSGDSGAGVGRTCGAVRAAMCSLFHPTGGGRAPSGPGPDGSAGTELSFSSQNHQDLRRATDCKNYFVTKRHGPGQGLLWGGTAGMYGLQSSCAPRMGLGAPPGAVRLGQAGGSCQLVIPKLKQSRTSSSNRLEELSPRHGPGHLVEVRWTITTTRTWETVAEDLLRKCAGNHYWTGAKLEQVPGSQPVILTRKSP